MMATKSQSKNRGKKVVETTLGKGTPDTHNKDESLDISHLKKPIDTNIFGLKQLLSLFHTATDEVKNYISYECEILFECKICRSIFRSLANFILHKRKFCTDKYFVADHCRKNVSNNYCETEIIKLDENDLKVDKTQSKSLSAVLDNLVNKQKSALLTQKYLEEDTNKSNSSNSSEEVADHSNLVLENIKDYNNIFFQTKTNSVDINSDLMKSEVMEIHSIFENDEAVLGPDGKILPTNKIPEYLPKKDLHCAVCNQSFSTKKTLSFHVKVKHNKSKLVYPCPECHETLSNTWCVFRHLYKVHRKSTADIKKVRDLVNDSAIIKKQDETPQNRRKLEDTKSVSYQEIEGKNNQQWIEDIEGANDIQMCAGCGRKFERKAALNSHSQTCLKRIALCNSIKETTKHREQEKKEEIEKAKSPSPVVIDVTDDGRKGSERRKPIVLRRNVKIMERHRKIRHVDRNSNMMKIKEKNLRRVLRIKSPNYVLPAFRNNTELVKMEKEDLVKKSVIVISDDESDHNETQSKGVMVTEKCSEIQKCAISSTNVDEIKKTDVLKKVLHALQKEPNTVDFSVESVRKINSQISEVLENFKRKRSNSLETPEKSSAAYPNEKQIGFNNDNNSIQNDSNSVIQSNYPNDANMSIKTDSLDRAMVMEMILGNSTKDNEHDIDNVSKKTKLAEPDQVETEEMENTKLSLNSSDKYDSNISSFSSSSSNFENQDNVTPSDNIQTTDSTVSPNKVEFVRSVPQRPIRIRTTKLHKDFLYDIIPNKSKSYRNGENQNKKKNKSCSN